MKEGLEIKSTCRSLSLTQHTLLFRVSLTYLFSMALGIEPLSSYMISKCYTTDPHFQSFELLIIHLLKNKQTKNFWSQRDGSVVKGAHTCSRGLAFGTQSSHPSITPDPKDLTTFSGIWILLTYHGTYMHIHRHKYRLRNKNNIFLRALEITNARHPLCA